MWTLYPFFFILLLNSKTVKEKHSISGMHLLSPLQGPKCQWVVTLIVTFVIKNNCLPYCQCAVLRKRVSFVWHTREDTHGFFFLYFHLLLKYRPLLSIWGVHFWCPINMKILPAHMIHEQDKSSDIEQHPPFGDRNESNTHPQNRSGGYKTNGNII